jgi:hypothetical protein
MHARQADDVVLPILAVADARCMALRESTDLIPHGGGTTVLGPLPVVESSPARHVSSPPLRVPRSLVLAALEVVVLALVIRAIAVAPSETGVVILGAFILLRMILGLGLESAPIAGSVPPAAPTAAAHTDSPATAGHALAASPPE